MSKTGGDGVALQVIIGGLAMGSIYGLVAFGLSLMYQTMGLINFAQGDLLMVGAYLGLTLMTALGLPFWTALVGATLLAAGFGVLLQRLAFQPVRKHDMSFQIIVTIGVSVLIQNGAAMVWGPEGRAFPSIFSSTPVSIGPLLIVPENAAVLAICIFMVVATSLFLKKTRIGVAMRAVAQDSRAAQLVGISIRTTDAMTFLITGALCAVAGILVSPIVYVTPTMGAMLGLKGFAATVVGGYGNLTGSVIGGLIIGLSESLGSAYVSSRYTDVFAFCILIGVLLLRPQGLMGEKQGRTV